MHTATNRLYCIRNDPPVITALFVSVLVTWMMWVLGIDLPFVEARWILSASIIAKTRGIWSNTVVSDAAKRCSTKSHPTTISSNLSENAINNHVKNFLSKISDHARRYARRRLFWRSGQYVSCFRSPLISSSESYHRRSFQPSSPMSRKWSRWMSSEAVLWRK